MRKFLWLPGLALFVLVQCKLVEKDTPSGTTALNGTPNLGAFPYGSPKDPAFVASQKVETKALALALTSTNGYTTQGTCDGLPRIPFRTPEGVCVGLVTQAIPFPRGIAAIPGTQDFLVVSMGKSSKWATKQGSIYRLKRTHQGWQAEQVSKIGGNLHQPSHITISKDAIAYIGHVDFHDTEEKTRGMIGRFDIKRNQWQPDFIADLPGTGSHPLIALKLDRHENLIVNVGSYSDHCEGSRNNPRTIDPSKPCLETESRNKNEVRAALRKYTKASNYQQFSVLARGLRNSMAIATHPNKDTILQGENSRDSIHKAKNYPNFSTPDGETPDQHVPIEELNVIVEGNHYGWPYCVGRFVHPSNPDDPRGAASPDDPEVSITMDVAPEYQGGDWKCSRNGPYAWPALALRGHTAPLGLTYLLDQELFNFWCGSCGGYAVIGMHGYQALGHRLSIVRVDNEGVPFPPVRDLIQHWEESNMGVRGMPVDVAVGSDSSLWITEDRQDSYSVLRLSFDKNQLAYEPLIFSTLGNPKVGAESDEVIDQRCKELDARLAVGDSRDTTFAEIQKEIIDPLCVSCHTSSATIALKQCDQLGSAFRLLKEPSTYLRAGDNDSPLLRAMRAQTGLRSMPPGGMTETDQEKLDLIEKWVAEGAGHLNVAVPQSVIKYADVSSSSISDPNKKCVVTQGTRLQAAKLPQMTEKSNHITFTLTGIMRPGENEYHDADCPLVDKTVYVYSPHF